MIKKYLIVILALAATSQSFAQQSCPDLFSSSQRVLPRPSEDAIHLAILELYELRTEMHSSDKTKSNIAKAMYIKKESELAQFISRDEILQRIRNINPEKKIVNESEKIHRNNDLAKLMMVEQFFEDNAFQLVPWKIGKDRIILSLSNPIHLALKLERYDILEPLLLVYKDYYKDFLESSNYDQLAKDKLKNLIDINYVEFGRTTLSRAYEKEDKGAMALLLEAGADPFIKLSDTKESVIRNIITKDNIELFSFVVSKINNIQELIFKYGSDETLLHQFAMHGRIDLADILIERGVDPLVPNKRGTTPLHYAASKGQLDFVNHYISKGYKIDVPNLEGTTPLASAVIASEAKLNNYAIQMEIVKSLAVAGANPNPKSDRGYSLRNWIAKNEPSVMAPYEQTVRDSAKPSAFSQKYQSIKSRINQIFKDKRVQTNE